MLHRKFYNLNLQILSLNVIKKKVFGVIFSSISIAIVLFCQTFVNSGRHNKCQLIPELMHIHTRENEQMSILELKDFNLCYRSLLVVQSQNLGCCEIPINSYRCTQ